MRRMTAVAMLIITFIPFYAFAEDKIEKNEPATVVEKFFSKKGHMIIKNFYDAGTIGSQYSSKIDIKAIVVSEPGNESDKIRGLRIEVTEGGRIEKRHASFLDIEEVDSLLKALDFMISKIEDYSKNADYTDYREVVFRSKDNFVIGFYQKGSTVYKPEIKTWAESGIISKSTSFMSKDGFIELKKIVQNGLDLAKTR